MELQWKSDGRLIMNILQPIDYYGQRGEQRYELTLSPVQVEQIFQFIKTNRESLTADLQKKADEIEASIKKSASKLKKLDPAKMTDVKVAGRKQEPHEGRA